MPTRKARGSAWTNFIVFFLKKNIILADTELSNEFFECNLKRKNIFKNQIIIKELDKNPNLIIKEDSDDKIKKELDKLGFEICIPCIVNKKAIAILLLTSKENIKSGYTSIDLKVFNYYI